MTDKPIRLDDKQKKILKAFLATFLPPTKSKRKNTANELDYIHTTLDRLFKQQFGFNLSRQSIVDTFAELGHTAYPMKSSYDYDTKKTKPTTKGEWTYKSVNGSKPEAPFTFFDISADTVRHLRKATMTLPSKTSPDKLEKTEKLKDKMQEFRQAIPND